MSECSLPRFLRRPYPGPFPEKSWLETPGWGYNQLFDFVKG